MHVELVPVIEVNIQEEEVAQALRKISPIAPGTYFYRISDLDSAILIVLAKSHLKGYFNGMWTLEEVYPFFGGYVLRINDQNTLFPQCCGELSDIIYWKHLAIYARSAYYHGHPEPSIRFTNTEVIFTCQDESEEFQPTTPVEIRVAKPALADAYTRVLVELVSFARKLDLVQQALQLPVESISGLLIYHNAELPGESPSS
ncbi:hypothetical protein [Hymenobacter terrestris]|uniref:Uncharacterized protein n=1 Tax=Hymenobacter terrestris TaxID=2748310 RepID=A0ABX2Q8Y1_9BACT|nr:hypothetical protein [Hymenobacter terrestris]NVO86202.1 hypothetical protein [Hymenobacter terrestris]